MSHYKTLGVSPDATPKDIKKAYQAGALKYHPDKTVNLPEDEKKAANERFKALNNAHDILIDPNTRKKYDKKLAGANKANTGANKANDSISPREIREFGNTVFPLLEQLRAELFWLERVTQPANDFHIKLQEIIATIDEMKDTLAHNARNRGNSPILDTNLETEIETVLLTVDELETLLKSEPAQKAKEITQFLGDISRGLQKILNYFREESHKTPIQTTAARRIDHTITKTIDAKDKLQNFKDAVEAKHNKQSNNDHDDRQESNRRPS